MNELRARVISQEKGIYQLSSGAEIKTATVSGKYRHEVQTVSDYPAVGDYVVAQWPEDGSPAVITALFPRKSCFIRRAAGSGRQEQIVAANIDTVFICMSLNNNFNLRRLERYLSAACESGAEPVVVLTKSDLCSDTERKKAEAQRAAPGADVLAVSSLDEDYGAFVIDTPGMRELGMWDSACGIDTAFSDIDALSCGCRYADCTHTSEPGCAVLAALAAGTLDMARLESYRKLKTENAYAADSSSYLQAKRTKFKEISRINKSNRKK